MPVQRFAQEALWLASSRSEASARAVSVLHLASAGLGLYLGLAGRRPVTSTA